MPGVVVEVFPNDNTPVVAGVLNDNVAVVTGVPKFNGALAGLLGAVNDKLDEVVVGWVAVPIPENKFRPADVVVVLNCNEGCAWAVVFGVIELPKLKFNVGWLAGAELGCCAGTPKPVVPLKPVEAL